MAMARIFKVLGRVRIGGILRVLCFVVLAQLGALVLSLRAAEARASEAMLSVGSELMRLDTPTPGRARTLFLNGAQIHLRTATTTDDVRSVLDRFQSVCRKRAGIDMPRAVSTKLEAASPHSRPAMLDGVIRAETTDQGAVGCVDTGKPLTLAAVVERLEAFARTGDLASVGELRYVFARRVDGKTNVLMLWSEGQMPLVEMFPATGDAPGQDSADIPRPPGARRLLSASESGQPYSTTAYVVPNGDLRSTVSFYKRSLQDAGWSEQVDETKTGASTAIFARRAGRTAALHIAHDQFRNVVVSFASLG